MSAPICAACDRLRAVLAAPYPIETTFDELTAANDALLIAASGLTVALREGAIAHDDVYDLLRVIHRHLKQTIADAKHAALTHEGSQA